MTWQWVVMILGLALLAVIATSFVVEGSVKAEARAEADAMMAPIEEIGSSLEEVRRDGR